MLLESKFALQKSRGNCWFSFISKIGIWCQCFRKTFADKNDNC